MIGGSTIAAACSGRLRPQLAKVDQILSCDSLRDRAVIDAAGVTIGHVDCVLLDPSSWQVRAVRVTLRREVTEEMGAVRSLFRRTTADIPTSAVQSVGDAVLLRLAAHDLRSGRPEGVEARAT